MRKGAWFISALVAATFLVAVACGGGGEPAPTPTSQPKATATPSGGATAPTGGTATEGTTTGEVVAVKLTENPYRFTPDKLSFQTGKTYTLSFEKPNEFHTFTVPDLGIDIFINAGEALKADITPSKAGAFNLLCTPHSELGMKGEVTVT